MGSLSAHTLARFLIGLSCLALLANCASVVKQPRLTINGLTFRNQTRATIHQAQVHVERTSAFANCSPVLAESECLTSFQPVPYRGNPISVHWEQNGRFNKTGEFHALPPEKLRPEIPAKLLVIINRAGTASAVLIQ